MNLKKCAATAMISSILLTGCSSSTSNIPQNDGKDVIASLTDKKIYADDTFDAIMDTSIGEGIYFSTVVKKLIDNQCPVDEAMKIDADMIVESTKNSYKSNYGDTAEEQLESDLKDNGYADVNEYRDYIISSLQQVRFLQKYVESNYEAVFEDYYTYAKPRTMSMLYISMTDVENPTEEEQARLDEVLASDVLHTDFAAAASLYSDDETTSSVGGKLGLVDTTTGLSSNFGADVEEVALTLADGEVSEAIKGTNGYYILKCESTDREVIQNRISNLGMDSPILYYDSYMIYLAYNTYTVTYKDDKVKEIIEKVINEALETRESNRGGTE